MERQQLLQELGRLRAAVYCAGQDCLDMEEVGKLNPTLQVAVVEQAAEVLEFYRLSTDPRPGLTEDSLTWGRLLRRCYTRYGAVEPDCLFGILHGLRCCGARLVAGKVGHRLERGEELPEAVYQPWRQILLGQYQAELTGLLQGRG